MVELRHPRFGFGARRGVTGARQTAGKCPGKNKLDREKEAANAIAAGFGSYISAMWTKGIRRLLLSFGGSFFRRR